METWVWIVIAAAAALVLLLLLFSLARRRRRNRRQETGERRERELRLRARPQEEFELHALAVASRTRLEEDWRVLQSGFVDDPEGSTRAAEGLVGRVMEERGYPDTEDRDQRAADLSVEHPRAVSAYRRGCSLLDGAHESPDGTETLRQAMRSFRTAFEELLGDREHAEEALR
jgi:hypothetical protein